MLDSDIKSFHAAEVSSASTNGGRRSYNEVISGVINNVWPHVTKAERQAGGVLTRFIYTLVADDTDGTLIAADYRLDNPTDGEDYVVAFEMPYGSTNADITGSERKYGSGKIVADIDAGDSTFDIVVDHVDLASGADAVIKVGDTCQLTSKTSPDSSSGDEEIITVSAVSNVDTTVTVTAVAPVANAYLASVGSRLSSVIVRGDIKTASSNYVVTTAGDGDYDSGLYPLVLDNLGTEQDSLTFSFTDATHFTCTGTSGNAYGSGDTATDFTPINPANSKPFFTLEAAGFSGTWAGGDTITVDIAEASFLMCLKRVVPAGCASLANNKITSVVTGESDS